MTDPVAYPRSYGVATGWKILLVICGLLFLGGGGFMVLKYLDDTAARNATFLAVFGVMVLAFGIYFIGETFFSKIILHADSIEVHYLFLTRRLARADIKGRKLQQTGYQYEGAVNAVTLVPNAAGLKKITISSVTASDDVLKNWLNSIPDLDKAEREASEAEILKDATGTGEREALKARLDAARKAGKSLTGTAVGLAIVGYIMPRNIVADLMLAVLPWLALAMAAKSPKLYTLNDVRNDARAGIGTALIAPGLILLLGGIMNFQLADWSDVQVHACAAAIALLMAFFAAKADPRLVEKKTIFIVLPLLFPYGYGSVIMADALLDASKPQVYEAHVISKQYTSGKGAHMELTIGSWGRHEGGSIPVDAFTYNTAKPGGTVCVFLRNGVLGIPWYDVSPCHF